MEETRAEMAALDSAQITLAEPWTFRTILRTINFPAGTHTVDTEIYEAALNAGVLEESYGHGATEGSEAGDPADPES